MKILINNNDLNEALNNVKNLGFVPTMGSIHEGHTSLIKNCKKFCSKTLVSIFINPTQFNNKKDFYKYPRNNKKDFLILKKLNIDFLYMPKIADIYNYKSKKFVISKKDKILCAKYRKGHFEGVMDVMNRLTKKISPKMIFMGEKDFQQLHLLKNFIEKKYKCKVIACKTIRDKNKLALSSRNFLLSKKELNLAGNLAQNLYLFKKFLKSNKILKQTLIKKKKELNKLFNIDIEYFELRNEFTLKNSNTTKNSRIFIAYYLNKIRLIDNI
jgi:pantoate--beta-alanine ligase